MKTTTQHSNALALFFLGVPSASLRSGFRQSLPDPISPIGSTKTSPHFGEMPEAEGLSPGIGRAPTNASIPNAALKLPEKITAPPAKKPGRLQRKNQYKLLLCLLLLTAPSLQAQQVCENSKRQLILSDGLKVILFKEMSGNRIYFVPVTLQLAQNNSKPECSYQEYTNPDSTSPDGAILHILLSWGLTKQQRGELRMCIKELYGNEALPGGALQLEPVSGLEISNKTKIGKTLNASLQSKGKPPTTSGGKTALSFHIGKNDVKTISEGFKKPEKLVEANFSISYTYKTYNCNTGTMKNNTVTLKGNIKKCCL